MRASFSLQLEIWAFDVDYVSQITSVGDKLGFAFIISADAISVSVKNKKTIINFFIAIGIFF